MLSSFYIALFLYIHGVPVYDSGVTISSVHSFWSYMAMASESSTQIIYSIMMYKKGIFHLNYFWISITDMKHGGAT